MGDMSVMSYVTSDIHHTHNKGNGLIHKEKVIINIQGTDETGRKPVIHAIETTPQMQCLAGYRDLRSKQ